MRMIKAANSWTDDHMKRASSPMPISAKLENQSGRGLEQQLADSLSLSCLSPDRIHSQHNW